MKVIQYYSKGHHDKEEFIKEVQIYGDFKGKVEDVRHVYAELTPSPTGGLLINFKPKSCKGSFPVTVIDAE
ncbi:hypothetical protein KQI88_10620 [Alkaliphilus sp. MSJ-5]|uniref:Uncharacterized protein n=1 Tax=Alkaliphilus flagellatus TaxID=2841507 RepID=A0ABS6G400_9FIRM|nr:hypothetical protein [Alkaliphilus flagellatus]MBU5676871.1 hypothetical protein [Alkaliphilus flagellatus]